MHSLQNSKNTHSLKQMLHSDALMLQNGKQKLQKLNKTTTVVSAYTLRLKIVHTSNDVIKPTVHNTSQFRVPKWTQHFALNVDPTMDGSNTRGKGGGEDVYKRCTEEEKEDEKEQGVEIVVKAGSGFRVFPFACRDDIVCDMDSPPAGPT